MKSKPSTTKSEKYRVLVTATLNYLIDHYTGELVLDDFDIVKQYYQEQKVLAEKYARQGQAKKLELKLQNFADILRRRADLRFADYIREKTGYHLDIFEELKRLGEEVLLKGKIENKQEDLKLSEQMLFYKTVEPDEDKTRKLHDIAINYYNEKIDQQKRNRNTTKVVKTEVEGDIIIETIEISTGPKSRYSIQSEALSPDGKMKLTVSISMTRNEDDAITSVDFSFPNIHSPAYAVRGIHKDITAFWKDNRTIVIETSKGNFFLHKHHVVQSFGDTVNIEYVERG